MKRKIQWIVLNSIVLVAYLYGEIYEVSGLLNVVLFFIGTYSSINMLYFSKNIQEEVFKNKNLKELNSVYPININIMLMYDIVLLTSLVYYGHFIVALLYSLGCIGEAIFYKRLKGILSE